MAPMDVEKRMNLSLDAIIKQQGKKDGSGRERSRGSKGKAKAGVEKALTKKTKTKGLGKVAAQQASKALGVQKKGLKLQKKGKRVALASPQQRREARGKQAAPVRKAESGRRAEPLLARRRRNGKPQQEASGKRTVDLPRLTDLRITISNEKAAGPSYSMPPMSVPGFQSYPYQSQPMWAAPSQMMQQPTYGYGPRNLQPNEGYARNVPEVPVPRQRMEFGASRKTVGAGAGPYIIPRRASYKDYDDPSQNKSYMRMDNR